MVTSVPWQLASTASKDLDRLDATLSRTRRAGRAAPPRHRSPRRRWSPRRPARASSVKAVRQGGTPVTEPGSRTATPRTPSASGSSATERGLAEADRVELTVGAVATAGTAWPGWTGRWSSSGTRCPASGSSPRSPRCTGVPPGRRGDSARALAGPGRAALPVRRPGACGGCDLQHVAAGRAAGLEGRGGARAAGPARRADRRRAGPRSASGSRRCPAGCSAGAPGSGTRSTPPAGPACSSTARTRWCRSTGAGSPTRRIQELPVLTPTGARWPAAEAVETVASTGGDVTVTELRDGAPSPGQWPGRRVREVAAGRDWTLPASAASGRCTRPRPTPSSTAGAGAAATRGRARSPGTSTAAPGCSPPALATQVGPTGRVTVVEAAPQGVAAGPGEPGRPAPRRGRVGPGGDRAGPSADHRPGRRGGARPAALRGRRPGGPRVGRRRPAGGRVRGLRPGRVRPGRAYLRRAGLAAGGAARHSTCSR